MKCFVSVVIFFIVDVMVIYFIFFVGEYVVCKFLILILDIFLYFWVEKGIVIVVFY